MNSQEAVAFVRSRMPSRGGSGQVAVKSAGGWAPGAGSGGRPAGGPVKAVAGSGSFGRLKQADIAWVCEQLTVTQESGIPLYRALGLLANMRKGTGLARRMHAMQDMLSEGAGISEVFSRQGRDWGSLVCALVAAGEASGDLGGAFQRASEIVMSRIRLKKKIRAGLMYPLVVIVVTFVLVATMLLVVVPRFEEIYGSLGAELPGVTLMVIALANQIPLLAVGVAAVGLAGFAVVRRSRTDRPLRFRLDRLKLRLPVVGTLLAKGVQARVSSTMAVLLSAGVPLMDVLQFAAGTASNVPVEDAFGRVRDDIADGSTFAAALEASGEFPELFVQLVAVGEESGSLPSMMEQYARRTSEEVEQSASAITSVIEPLMMVVVGGVVGVFLLALYLPIISLSTAIK